MSLQKSCTFAGKTPQKVVKTLRMSFNPDIRNIHFWSVTLKAKAPGRVDKMMDTKHPSIFFTLGFGVNKDNIWGWFSTLYVL